MQEGVEGRHRHRAHPLGHARRAGGAQRPPALRTARAGRQEPRAGRIALVHNGIIENHDELRAELPGPRLRVRQPDRHRGHRAPGRPLYDGDLFAAGARPPLHAPGAPTRSRSSARDEPQRVVARARARRWCGRGPAANLPGQRRDGAGRRDRPDHLPGRGRPGRPAAGPLLDHRMPRRRRSARERPVKTVQAHSGAAELGPYRHYMQKEIFEQPAPSPTRSRASRRSRPSCSATAPPRCSGRSTRC